MSNIFQAADKADTGKKRAFAGWKSTIRFDSPKLQSQVPIRYGKVDVEPLIDVEGEILKVGPNGQPVESHWKKVHYENGQEITEEQIRKVQKVDDQLVDVVDLPRTQTISISEQRPIEECTLDENDPTVSLGTCIPVEDINKYVAESMNEVWAEDSFGVLRLAEYLEKERLALFFPYCYGRGLKIYTVTGYPFRVEAKLFLLMRMNIGQMILRHPIQVQQGQPQETKRLVLATPRLVRKKAQPTL